MRTLVEYFKESVQRTSRGYEQLHIKLYHPLCCAHAWLIPVKEAENGVWLVTHSTGDNGLLSRAAANEKGWTVIREPRGLMRAYIRWWRQGETDPDGSYQGCPIMFFEEGREPVDPASPDSCYIRMPHLDEKPVETHETSQIPLPLEHKYAGEDPRFL